MISDANQYQKAQEELRELQEWLARLQQQHSIPTKRLTKAGVEKMISRLRGELAIYEGSR